MARNAAPRPKDRGQLSIQVDAAADNLPALMVATRHQANAAMQEGNLDQADRLDEQAASLALSFQIFLRHQIREIDGSAEMRALVTELSKLNKEMQDIIAETQKIATFLKRVTAIATGLMSFVGKALK